jgi:hypothetical protein
VLAARTSKPPTSALRLAFRGFLRDLGKSKFSLVIASTILILAFRYPYTTGLINGTVVVPRPTYNEVPVNMGQIVGAGKSSFAAIVVALVFAHFA